MRVPLEFDDNLDERLTRAVFLDRFLAGRPPHQKWAVGIAAFLGAEKRGVGPHVSRN